MSSKIRIVAAALAAASIGALPAVASARHGHGHGRHGHNQTTVFGTVASFTGGVLTIKETGGMTVSAKVTAATEIECEGVAKIADHGGRGSSGAADNSTAGTDDTAAEMEHPASGTTTTPATHEDNSTEAAEHAAGDDSDAPGSTTKPAGSGPAPRAATVCDKTALVSGAVVTRARIRDGGTGAAFKQIKLAS